MMNFSQLVSIKEKLFLFVNLTTVHGRTLFENCSVYEMFEAIKFSN